MKISSAFVVLSSLATTYGFVVSPLARTGVSVLAEQLSGDEIDFDAPTRRAAAVGNVVRTPSIGFGGFQVGVPRFLANAFGMSKPTKQDNIFLEDEECYLGKDGNLDHCADFDPQHNISP